MPTYKKVLIFFQVKKIIFIKNVFLCLLFFWKLYECELSNQVHLHTKSHPQSHSFFWYHTVPNSVPRVIWNFFGTPKVPKKYWLDIMSLSVRLYEKGLKRLYKCCVLKIRYRIRRVTEFSTEFLNLQNSVPNSSKSKIRYRIRQIPKFNTKFFKNPKFSTEFFNFQNLVPNSSNFKIRYRIL